MDPSDAKAAENNAKMEPPGVHSGAPWNPTGAARTLLGQLEDGLGDILAQLCGHGSDFLTTFAEKL